MRSKTTNKFSPEVRARAVRMVTEHETEHPSRWAAVSSIAAKVGCSAHTLNEADLPLNFHPAAIRASAFFVTPNGAVGATGGNAKLPHCVALEPVAAMIPA
jgi:hypothetical protein